MTDAPAFLERIEEITQRQNKTDITLNRLADSFERMEKVMAERSAAPKFWIVTIIGTLGLGFGGLAFFVNATISQSISPISAQIASISTIATRNADAIEKLQSRTNESREADSRSEEDRRQLNDRLRTIEQATNEGKEERLKTAGEVQRAIERIDTLLEIAGLDQPREKK